MCAQIPEHALRVAEMQPVAPGTWQPFGAPACEQLIFEAELDAGFAIGVGAVDGIDGLIGRQVGDERVDGGAVGWRRRGAEERSGGKECVSTCRSRWSTYH